MTVFATVGSTRFDDLLESLWADDFLSHLSQFHSTLIVQCGMDKLFHREFSQASIDVKCFSYSNSLSSHINESDLVISHGGFSRFVRV